MTYPSGFSMPGAFHNDVGSTTTTTTAASPPLIFRPPLSSPSPSGSAFLERRRKRGRPGTAAAATADDDDAPPVVSLFGAAAAPQHTPVKAYALAGTLDTPGQAEADALGESMYSDSNYRTALGSKRSRHDKDDDDDDLSSGGAPTLLFRHDPPPLPAQGWGSVAISAVGGVVGRVWEFCKAGAFKGFYAGGGRGFAMTTCSTGAMVESPDDAPLPPAAAAAADDDDNDDSCNHHFHHYHDNYEHRVPGNFPPSQTDDTSYHFRAVVDDIAPPTPADNEQRHLYPYQPPSPSPSIPAAKRRQTTHADDLGRNWVIVNDGTTHSSSSSSRSGRPFAAATTRKISSGHQSSSRNRNYTPSVTTGRRISASPNNISRASMPSAPRFSYRPETPSSEQQQQQRRPPSSASYASPRSASPTKPASTPYTHNHHPYTTASTASIASPSQTHSYSGFSQSRSSNGGGGHRRRRSGTVASTSSGAHRRANSAASAVSSRGDSGEASSSPRKNHDSPRLDAEAKHLAARRKMEERDADVRISAFNKRLQDMIRQGKEALGTTIEINDAVGDDWVDEE